MNARLGDMRDGLAGRFLISVLLLAAGLLDNRLSPPLLFSSVTFSVVLHVHPSSAPHAI